MRPSWKRKWPIKTSSKRTFRWTYLYSKHVFISSRKHKMEFEEQSREWTSYQMKVEVLLFSQSLFFCNEHSFLFNLTKLEWLKHYIKSICWYVDLSKKSLNVNKKSPQLLANSAFSRKIPFFQKLQISRQKFHSKLPKIAINCPNWSHGFQPNCSMVRHIQRWNGDLVLLENYEKDWIVFPAFF